MIDWQPSASISALQQRADILRYIREYFFQQKVMEVDAAVLSQCAVSDPFIDTLEVSFRGHPHAAVETAYLQTSPEYVMKRLLAAGCPSIYQMGKVFRNGEEGRIHNPEFTMLEWYRLGFDEQQLMDDVEALVLPLLKPVLGFEQIERLSYAELFQQQLNIDVNSITCEELEQLAKGYVDFASNFDDLDGGLNFLMSHIIEPNLKDRAVFVTDYPASQAALANVRVNEQGVTVARRFELFVKGIELANGFHELTDAAEQQRRLEADRDERKALGLPARPLDLRLVAALKAGMPDCAGVALGVDRLVMLATGAGSLQDVIPFTYRQA